MKGATKRKRTADLITTVLTLLVLAFSVAAVGSALLLRETGRGVAGFSLGTVQSGSMASGGIEKGDVVTIRSRDAYQAGDVIAFYRVPNHYDKPRGEVDLSRASVWIHQIIDISTDASGRTCYLTKGTDNDYDDGAYVPQDFVIGKAELVSEGLGSVLKFISSSRGLMILVVVPCFLLELYLCWELCGLISRLREERGKAKNPPEKSPAGEKGGSADAQKEKSSSVPVHLY